jgi:hypothetical protein
VALLIGPGRTSAVLVSAGFERESWQRESVRQWAPVGGCRRSVERGRFGKWGKILEINVANVTASI